jgi:hypothetical protein
MVHLVDLAAAICIAQWRSMRDTKQQRRIDADIRAESEQNARAK